MAGFCLGLYNKFDCINIERKKKFILVKSFATECHFPQQQCCMQHQSKHIDKLRDCLLYIFQQVVHCYKNINKIHQRSVFTFKCILKQPQFSISRQVSRSVAAGGDPKAPVSFATTRRQGRANSFPWPIKTTYPSMMVFIYRPQKDERLS